MTRWQQNVLIISCAWALGITVYLRYQELPKAQEYAMRAYFVCIERQAVASIKPDKCLENVDDDWDVWMNRTWGKIAAVALVPVGAGWFAIFVGLYVYRRIRLDRAGKSDSRPREPE